MWTSPLRWNEEERRLYLDTLRAFKKNLRRHVPDVEKEFDRVYDTIRPVNLSERADQIFEQATEDAYGEYMVWVDGEYDA